MKHRLLFVLSSAGIVIGLIAAYAFNIVPSSQPPAFKPASNPYKEGIYATGILESDQPVGANINVYPEVSGTVTQIFVTEGQKVAKGTALLKIEDSVQKATAEQQQSLMQAAKTMLDELKAEPRKETLLVAKAQVGAAKATLKNVQDELAKRQESYKADPQSVSKDDLDNSINAVKVAETNLEVTTRQYELTKAGAWSYDIENQEKQYAALEKSYLSAKALLEKYTITAPADGDVLSINVATGSYVSPQGAYDTYTGGNDPALVMGSSRTSLNVRVYIDEILVHRLPSADKIKAQMSIRGTDTKLPLEFVRLQPYVSPKIELSNEKTERVDVRVLPVIFKVINTKNVDLYPGQQVDVYIGE